MKTVKFVSSVSLFAVAPVVLALGPTALAHHGKGEHPKQHINRRLENQERRIEQGVKSGKLSAEKAAELRAKSAEIRSKEAADLQAGGGHLTPEQRKEIRQDLNEVSKEIKEAKHGSAPAAPSAPAAAPAVTQ